MTCLSLFVCGFPGTIWNYLLIWRNYLLIWRNYLLIWRNYLLNFPHKRLRHVPKIRWTREIAATMGKHVTQYIEIYYMFFYVKLLILFCTVITTYCSISITVLLYCIVLYSKNFWILTMKSTYAVYGSGLAPTFGDLLAKKRFSIHKELAVLIVDELSWTLPNQLKLPRRWASKAPCSFF